MKTSLRLLLLVCLLQPLVSLAQSYCQPNFTSGPAGINISGFALAAIDNPGSGDDAYTSYVNGGANMITTLAPGGTYSATIISGSFPFLPGTYAYYSVWVDLDHNNAFELDEKLAVVTTDQMFETASPSLTIPADAITGYTRLRVLCTFEMDPTNACLVDDYGEAEDYTVVIDDGAPCIPVYGFGTAVGVYIDGVVFGAINNVGSGGTDGHAYSIMLNSGSGSITSVAPGNSYPMNITAGSIDPPGGTVVYYTVWVDLDQDGNFQPIEKLAVGTSTDPGQILQMNVDIPTDTRTGYTRMRVMCTYDMDPTDACGNFAWGETEDYTLVIDDGSPCIPVFGYQASEGDYVSAVQLEGLNWIVATTPPLSGYEDATAFGAHLQSGVTSQLTVTKGTFGGGNFVSVWIDWSNNGFDSLDLLGTQIVSGSGGTATFNVTPPATPGYARMRVACSYGELGGPCGTADYGHAVDFTLSIGRAGWPCLPLQGYGTQLGDGFTDLMLEVYHYTSQHAFPYYEWSSSIPYHYEAGGAVTISFTAGSYAPETYRLSMDMNDDGDFFDTNEEPLVRTSMVAGESITMVYQLPPNCIPGQHFMRLRANDDANYPLVDPCEDQLYGQIFDWVVAVEDPNGPCMPFINLWTTSGDFIDGVQLGGAQNNGTGGAYGPAYHDYPSPTIGLLMGNTDTLRISSGANGGDTYTAWIDYNDDNDFGDANESLGWIGIADPYSTGDLIFTIPPGTTPGIKHMRVRCATTPLGDACATTNTGETEDYRVYIELSTGVMAATTADLRLLPTTDGVQLLTDASLIGNSYLLLDATGRTLATGRITADRTDLPMIAFAKGAYTVVLGNGEERAAKRFVW